MAIHYKYKSRVYQIWINMKQRCTNPKLKRYQLYGGRGISVCAEWMNFVNFYDEMGDPPANHTIDLIDTNKNYCKDNCRWITHGEKALTNRKMLLFTVDGVTLCARHWSLKLGLNKSWVSQMKHRGKTHEQIEEFIKRKMNGKKCS